jgi:hypothetical protein
VRLVPIRLWLLLAVLCVAGLAVLGTAWGFTRADRVMTERALDRFVTQVMTESRAERWGAVRGVATRDALDGLERHREEWSHQKQVLARSLGSGGWAIWVEVPRGARYHLKVDETTWHPLAPPWRRRSFRVTTFERIG